MLIGGPLADVPLPNAPAIRRNQLIALHQKLVLEFVDANLGNGVRLISVDVLLPNALIIKRSQSVALPQRRVPEFADVNPGNGVRLILAHVSYPD